MFLIWDLIKEHKWFVGVILLVMLSNYVYIFHYEDRFYLHLWFFIGLVIWFIVIPIIREFIIYRKVSELNRKKLLEWEKKKELIKKRNQRLKINYLNGLPITIVDKDGVVKIIQMDKPDIIVNTPN
jgi:hypothetical protein